MSLLSKVLIQTYVGKITREETDAYHLALGRFVSAFSDIEASMQATLWHFAGVSTPTAQAVFSGTRIEGAMQFIKSDSRCTAMEEKQTQPNSTHLHATGASQQAQK